jgi:hypothetical protein
MKNVPPVRNIDEIYLVLDIDANQSSSRLFLVLRRLGKGGSIQPKNQVTRAAMHSLLNDDRVFILKVFNGTKHGYLRIENEKDKENIINALKELVSLEESSLLLSAEIYDKAKLITLAQPLNIKNMNMSRNFDPPPEQVDDISSCEELAVSLFPNPMIRRNGSRSSEKWDKNKDMVISILKGEEVGGKDIVASKLVDQGILFPVCGIVQREEATIMLIYKSDLRLCIKPAIPELEHDGGVVLYRIFPCQDGTYDVKRMLRVANVAGNTRNVTVHPHSPTRYHNPDARSVKFDELVAAFESEDRKNMVLNESVPELLGGLSALGIVDSSSSRYNQIIGIYIVRLIHLCRWRCC